MTDEEFLRALEDCSLAAGEFGHQAHVRAGYLYLRQHEFAEALVRMRRSLRAFAGHHGAPGRYHETVTVAYLALIQQHMFERGSAHSWESFAQQNPDLFNPELLSEYYERSVLDSTAARCVFILPNVRHGSEKTTA